MDDLKKLLQVVEALDDDNRAKEEQPPTDAELSDARKGLYTALEEATSGEPDLEAARAIGAAIQKIDAELVTRGEEREKARQEAEEILRSVKASDQPAEDDKSDDDASDDAKDDDQDGDKGEGEAQGEAEEKKVAVAASLADALTRSTKRRVERVQERAGEPVGNVLVSAVGLAQGHGISQEATLDDVADIFNRFAHQTKRGGQVLLHMDKLYPEDRVLGNVADENTRKMDDVASPRAITAAGGVCGPLEADFNHPICGDRGRPIRDALPAFQANRGGITFAPTASLGDLTDAITVWTAATDATPGSDTKACPRVDCENALTADVDAVVACLTVGNFQARFNPEFWRSRLDLLMVEHDRIAEQTIYASIETNSTQLTYTGSTGTPLDFLEAVDKAIYGIGSRNRLLRTGYVAILPDFVRLAIREALVAQMPAGSTDLFAVADAQINQFFSSRSVSVVWTPDVDIAAAEVGASALDTFPTDADLIIFPQGTWLFLDGGTLDLGTQIVDSTLNATNDRQAFMETFEGVTQRGCESLSINVSGFAEGCLCPAGVS